MRLFAVPMVVAFRIGENAASIAKGLREAHLPEGARIPGIDRSSTIRVM